MWLPSGMLYSAATGSAPNSCFAGAVQTEAGLCWLLGQIGQL